MKVWELREILEDVDGEVEIVIATQPMWPLANAVSNVMLNSEREGYDETEGRDSEDDPEIELLWIATGGNQADDWDSPYAPSDVFVL